MKKLVHLTFILSTVLMLVSILAMPAEATAPSTIYIVNSNADGIFDPFACGGSNDCTLRDAISLANGSAGSDIIRFDTGALSSMLINLNAPLPAITRPLEIDGVTGPDNPGFCPTENEEADLSIILSGQLMGVDSDGLVVDANDVTIRGLSIVFFGKAGIELNGDNGLVVCNTIGKYSSGPQAANNTGIRIESGQGNVIGGTTPEERNIISGNTLSGIRVDGTAIATLIEGNYIGVADNGVVGSGNGRHGIFHVQGSALTIRNNVITDNGEHGIRSESDDVAIRDNIIGLSVDEMTGLGNGLDGINVIGDNAEITRNVVADSGGDGIDINGTSTDVTDNFVGVNSLNPLLDFGNGDDGIDGGQFVDGNSIRFNDDDGIVGIDEVIDNTISNNDVSYNGGDGIAGDAASITDNIVTYNLGSGIELDGGGTVDIDKNKVYFNSSHGIHLTDYDNVTITGNFIGTDTGCVCYYGNGGDGIRIEGQDFFGSSDNITIGGAGAGNRNDISDNGGNGIALYGELTDTLSIRGNNIGVHPNTTTDMGNGKNGILLSLEGAFTVNVGSDGVENRIAHNALNGISVESADSVANTLRHNFIYDNGGLGIDLHGAGEAVGEVTLNDAGDSDSGPNNLQNYLDLTSITEGGRLIGTIEGLTNVEIEIDIYQLDSCDPSGFGEGGDTLIATYSDTFFGVIGQPGTINFDEILATTPPLGAYVIALVTDEDGNTSEFSNCVQVVKATFIVNSTDNLNDATPGDGTCETSLTGKCTLRAVIQEVNELDDGPYAITFDFGPLIGGQPRIIQDTQELPVVTTPIILNAAQLPGASCASAESPAVHRLIIDGTNAPAGSDGLTLGTEASGSSIRGLRIRNFPDDGLRINGDNNTINCNTFNNNGGQAVDVIGNDNQIGGTGTVGRNIINSSGSHGVRIGGNGTRNLVQGNYIGVESDGSTASANGGSGVYVDGGGTNRIGGSIGFAANVIAANDNHGIEFGGGGGGNQVWGNLIGVDATGLVALGNGASGVRIESSINGNEIGGDSDSKRNVISDNGDHGIHLFSAGNEIRRNYIGTDVNGVNDLGNGGSGVRIIDGDSNVIGGDVSAESNIISGNDGIGVYLGGNAVFTTVRYNSIGVDANGDPLGNGLSGVRLLADVSQALLRNNIIAHNATDGIAVDSTVGNSQFSINEIYANGEMGIDLDNDDVVTVNDIDDTDSGGNGLMNFPTITGADASSGMVTVTLVSLAQRTYRIHVYRNQACDGTHGEGERYVGSVDVDIVGSGSGFVEVSAEMPFNFNGGDQLTATATPLTSPILDGTSEFSKCFPATGNTPTATSVSEQLTVNSNLSSVVRGLSSLLVVLTGWVWFRPKLTLSHRIITKR